MGPRRRRCRSRNPWSVRSPPVGGIGWPSPSSRTRRTRAGTACPRSGQERRQPSRSASGLPAALSGRGPRASVQPWVVHVVGAVVAGPAPCRTSRYRSHPLQDGQDRHPTPVGTPRNKPRIDRSAASRRFPDPALLLPRERFHIQDAWGGEAHPPGRGTRAAETAAPRMKLRRHALPDFAIGRRSGPEGSGRLPRPVA